MGKSMLTGNQVIIFSYKNESATPLTLLEFVFQAKNMLLSFVITEVILIGLWDGFWLRYVT